MSGKIETQVWLHGGMEFMEVRQQARPFALHFHRTYVIEVVTAGIDSCEMSGKTVFAEPGDILLIPPFQAHSGGFASNGSIAYRSFYPLVSHLEPMAQAEGKAIAGISGGVIRNPGLAKRLLEAHDALREHNDKPFQQAIAELIWNESKCQEATMDLGSNVARTMLLRCRENRSLNAWASEFGYSPFHFVRKFSQFTGMTPHRFLIAARVEWARRALRRGQSPANVALEAGFYDQAHLTRAFASIVGMTPGAYAKNAKIYNEA